MTPDSSSGPPVPAFAAGPGPGPDPSPRRWLILTVIGVAQLMVVLDATIVNIALPSAQQALGFSTTDRQWVLTAYSLAFGALLLPGGRLSDMFGRRRTFIVGLAGFAAASAAGGAAPGLGWLVAARAAQGAFGALLAPSALALLSTTFSDSRERAKALGIFTAIAGGGGAIGLILGGVLTQWLSWRWCLFVNVIFALAALAGAITLITDPVRSGRRRIDVLGSLLAASGLAAVVFGFSQASTDGWSSATTIGLLAGGVILLAAFGVTEGRVARPLVPPGILADRVRSAAYLGAIMAGIGVIGMFLLVTYYLQGVLGFTPLQAGLGFLPFVGGVIIAANFVSNVGLARLGPRVVVPAGMIAAAAGAAWLTQVGDHGSYGTVVAPGQFLIGAGAGCAVVSAFSLGPAGARPEAAGVAAALVNASNQIGGSLGAALLNTIAASATATYLAQHALPAAAAVHGDVVAFTSLIAVFAAGAVITAALYPRRDRVAVPAARGPAVPPAAAPGLNANPPAGSHDGTAAANGTHS